MPIIPEVEGGVEVGGTGVGAGVSVGVGESTEPTIYRTEPFDDPDDPYNDPPNPFNFGNYQPSR